MYTLEEVLGQVIDFMVARKNCELFNHHVRTKLIELMSLRIRDIGFCISSSGNHAGRSVPCYFDVEHTFHHLRIYVEDLERQVEADEGVQVMDVSAMEIPQTDYHKCSQLEVVKQRGSRNGRHIPKYMPPFPGVHTYKNTSMNLFVDRGYVIARDRRAEHARHVQKALNKFYLQTEPTFSLFSEPQDNAKFLVLSLKKPKQPAFLSALMPHDEVFDENIYESTSTELSEKAKANPFLQPAKVPSPQPNNSVFGEELDLDLTEKLVKETVAEQPNECAIC